MKIGHVRVSTQQNACAIVLVHRLLRTIFSFLKERENSEDSRIWDSLTDEQKKEVLLAYDESEASLIKDKDVWNKLK